MALLHCKFCVSLLESWFIYAFLASRIADATILYSCKVLTFICHLNHNHNFTVITGKTYAIIFDRVYGSSILSSPLYRQEFIILEISSKIRNSWYRIRGKFCGMKFSLNRMQIGFSQCGKVACYVLLQISNCRKLANFHGLNFHCISRWPWNPRNLHTAEISVHTVYSC